MHRRAHTWSARALIVALAFGAAAVGNAVAEPWSGADRQGAAGNGLTGAALSKSERRQIAKIARSQAKAQVKRMTAKLRGPAGPAGSAGLTGPAGTDGTALAYAQVNDEATLVAGRSKNVDGVAGRLNPITLAPDPGHYCFALAEGIVVDNIIATLQGDMVPVADKQLTATIGGLSGCPAGFQDAAVAYHSNGMSTGVNRNFFVLFN